MSEQPYVSYARNAEDVVLWRALGQVREGRYVEVRSSSVDHPGDPVRAFHEHGWSGLAVCADPDAAARVRELRDRDVVVEAPVGDEAGGGHLRLSTVLDEHLSGELHVLVVDAPGEQEPVLRSAELARHRPWVVVVAVSDPSASSAGHEAWEQAVLSAGYRACLFDGLNRFFVADEHGEIADALSYPASPADGAVRHHEREQLRRIDELEDQLRTSERDLVRWRGLALEGWAELQGHVSSGQGIESAHLREQLTLMQQTLSWRVTKPLRAVRRMQNARSGRA